MREHFNAGLKSPLQPLGRLPDREAQLLQLFFRRGTWRIDHEVDGASGLREWDYLTQAFSACKDRSEEHTSELQSQFHLVWRLLLEKKKQKKKNTTKQKTE